jgi:tRNA dimethylallyltransferase
MSPSSDTRPPVVVVTGPTAAGKTPLAIELARRFDGEVVNCDSMQVYRYMDIGTGKASAEQRRQVPHHMLDVVTPDVAYSAGRYAREARAAAATIHARGRLVLLTGGTGLYVRAFLEGLVEAGEADSELRGRLEREHAAAVAAGRPAALHERLAALDPEAARDIHPHDLKRVIRALEICAQGRGGASERRRRHGFGDRPYRSLHLALDPGVAEIDRRSDARCRAMIEAGLLQEVRELRRRGYGPQLRPMQAIGYRHLNPVVDGVDTLDNALARMQRDTRRFARRQRTWLRKLPEVVWLDPRRPERIEARVKEFLAQEAGSYST